MNEAVEAEGHKMQNCYPYTVVFRGRRHVLFWCSPDNGSDHFLKTAEGKILVSASLVAVSNSDELRDTLIFHVDEGIEVSIDSFLRRVRRLRAGKVAGAKACSELLDGLEFLEDFARTFSIEDIRLFQDKEVAIVFDKLFFGNNFPAMTPAGRSYSPIWTRREVKLIKDVVKMAWACALVELQEVLDVREKQ